MFGLAVMDVPVDQRVSVCKDLFGFSLIDAVALLAFPGVTFVPLKADYVAKVNYWSHCLSGYRAKLRYSIPMR